MKFGIVAEGGAFRTMFSCGAMDALLDHDIMPDYFVGVSAGIAYGVSYISKQSGRNLEVLQRFVKDRRYMGPHHLLRRQNRCYFNLDFVYREIPEKHVPFDFTTFRQFPGDVEAVLTDVKTGRPIYHEVSKDPRSFVALQASCALPLISPIEKVGNYLCMDGGITDPIPVQRALAQGCDKVLVLLTREHGYTKGEEKAVQLAQRCYGKYPAFVKALKQRATVYNRECRLVDEMEVSGKILTIRPNDTHGFHRLERDIVKITTFYQEGYQQVVDRLAEINAYLANSR